MPRDKKRCICKKVIYPSREAAHSIIGLLIDRDSRPDLLSIYRCDVLKVSRTGWHVGHSHKKYDAFLKEKNNATI